MKNFKNFIPSSSYKLILWIIAEILLLLLIFALGIRVGLHKARYSYQWGENYERNFMGPRHEPRMPGMPPIEKGRPIDFLRDKDEFRNAQGMGGEIVSISDNNIVIKDRDNKENTVVVNDKTIMKFRREDLEIGDLKSGQRIVVVGKPDDSGVINAELIRIFE